MNATKAALIVKKSPSGIVGGIVGNIIQSEIKRDNEEKK
jgi:hypothetical protein